MPQPTDHNHEILRAALIGLQHSLAEVERRIGELRARVAGRVAPSPAAPAAKPAGGRRPMSAAARHRIAMAQKKRWAAYKAEHAKPAAKPKAQKRTLSAEGRARIVAATKKRWAAFHKAQQAPKAPAAKKTAPKPAAKVETAPPPAAAAAPGGEA